MRKLFWTWTTLLASLAALGATGGRTSVQSRAERALSPAERSQAPTEARSSAAEKTPLSPAKHTLSLGAARPGSAPADPRLRWSAVGAASAGAAPAIAEQGGAPRFPTGPPQA
ncbi:MAG: hypothetical protein AB7R55_09455 [Gemmatimonadales bacterium]